jgi:ribosomal protein S18 acetylase RimI-like enzyme
METIRIIKADLSHANLLSKLGAVTFSETFAHQNNPDDFNNYLQKSFNKEQIEKELNENGSTFLLAYSVGELAGYVRLRESDELQDKFPGKRLLELQRIYSLKQFIGKGIGKALLNFSINFAKQNNFDILWLGVWEHNQHAIQFYSHFGFEPFDHHAFMIGNDEQTDILMKLKIN